MDGKEEAIDRELTRLLEEMASKFKATADALMAITAFGIALDAEKRPAGVERRNVLAGAFMTLVQAMPAAWASIAEAHPDMTPLQRAEMVQRAVETLFDVELGEMRMVQVEPAQ